MTDAQGWTLLAMIGVLLSVIGGLVVNQFHLLRAYLDARFESVERQLVHLDRDVQTLVHDRFRRED
jgi:hypothetical protein